MNFLIINHYAGSPDYGMEFRHYYLGKELRKQGHSLTIIGADYSHIRNIQPVVRNDFEKEIIDGIEYFWIKTPAYKGNGLGRIKNMFTFLYKLRYKSNKFFNDKKYDVVIASSTYPLDILPAHRIAKMMNAKLVYEIHDLWPLSPMELGGYSKYHPFIMLLQYAEDYAYKHCDKVISILPLTLEHTTSRGLDKNKWHHIPNGIACDEWENNNATLPEQHELLFKRLKTANKKIILYAGGVNLSNAIDNIVNTAKITQTLDIHYVIVGNGNEKQQLINRVKTENIENITFLAPVNKKLVSLLLSKADMLILSFNKSKLYKYGVSLNKVYDYMMSGKPIIQAIEAGNDDVAIAKCGVSVLPDNPKALKEAIEKVLLLSEAERDVMGQNGKKYVLANHNYEVLAKRFVEVFEDYENN